MTDWPEDPACPHCGNPLTMSEPPQGGRTERAALWTASHVASAAFPATVFTTVVLWVVVNVIWRPFEPYPVIVYAVTSAVLATAATLQGPLILIAQRRSAERDRMRDEEAYHVTIHTENDIHRIEAKLDALREQVELYTRQND